MNTTPPIVLAYLEAERQKVAALWRHIHTELQKPGPESWDIPERRGSG